MIIEIKLKKRFLSLPDLTGYHYSKQTVVWMNENSN
jgi:hypothetical protein